MPEKIARHLVIADGLFPEFPFQGNGYHRLGIKIVMVRHVLPHRLQNDEFISEYPFRPQVEEKEKDHGEYEGMHAPASPPAAEEPAGQKGQNDNQRYREPDGSTIPSKPNFRNDGGNRGKDSQSLRDSEKRRKASLTKGGRGRP